VEELEFLIFKHLLSSSKQTHDAASQTECTGLDNNQDPGSESGKKTVLLDKNQNIHEYSDKISLAWFRESSFPLTPKLYQVCPLTPTPRTITRHQQSQLLGSTTIRRVKKSLFSKQSSFSFSCFVPAKQSIGVNNPTCVPIFELFSISI